MGIAKSTIPDVCKTPSPGGPVPIPYPVIVSMSNSLAKGTKTVKVDGKKMAAVKGSEFSRCNGDEPGTAGGVKSSTNMKEATWLLYSFDVKLDGKNACRLSDKMMMNHGNSACLGGEIQFPVMKGVPGKDKCQICKRAQDEDGTQSYEEYFTDEEKAEFDAIEKDFPEQANMLPPKDARYRTLNKAKRSSSRKQFKNARAKAKASGIDIHEDEVHHPHPLAHGGCPIHQKMIKKETPEDSAADERINAVLDKVNERTGVS